MCPHFCGSCMMKSCALAARAAASIDAMLASVSAAMLRAMVVANSVGSWLTSPIRDLVHVPVKVTLIGSNFAGSPHKACSGSVLFGSVQHDRASYPSDLP